MTVEAIRGLPIATVPVVRAYIRQLRRKNRTGRVLGIHAQPVWNGRRELELNGVTVLVRPCVSALAVREALVEHGDRPQDYLVVITDVGDDDLGHGLRARLADNILHPVKQWEAVKDSFEAADIDPALTDLKAWAPRALLDHEPATGWPPAPGGTLTRDLALGLLAAELLGRDRDGHSYADSEHVDAQTVLRWSLDPVARRRWDSVETALREGLTGWLSERTGAAGVWTLQAVAAGHGSDAVALGLVAQLLWLPDVTGEVPARARGQLIAWLGGRDPGAPAARTWGRVASAFVGELLAARDPVAHSVIARAEQLLTDLGAGELVRRSEQLPASLDIRLREFAAEVRRAAAAGHRTTIAAAENAHITVRGHDLAASDERARTATMALRLLRWLATDPTPVATLADALDRQAGVSAWVDRAYADVFTGDPDPQVAQAYSVLTVPVRARRDAEDEELARLLARVTEDDADLGRIVAVEDALARVVRPLVHTGRRVLLVVLDGMSTGVLATIGEGLQARRWLELVDGALGHRQALLPLLPTVTEICRTSLLTGRPIAGDQSVEKAGFAGAVGDVKAQLFHKNELRAPAGEAVAPDVRRAIADLDVAVVGVVLNTIDDALDKMDPGGTTWAVDQVQHLAVLTELARSAGRLLVLTADHGHVVERGSVLRSVPGDGGARWRPASGPAAPGEIVLQGRRVRLGGGRIVAPWREDIRYGPKKAGYHGGASAAEVSVPIAVFDTGAGDSVGGWVPAPPPEPVWWLSPLATGALEPAGPPPAAPTLFEPDASVGGSLVDALLASNTYAKQRTRAGRAAPDDVRVRAVVQALLAHDGRLHETTLATEAGIPAARLRTVLAAVRRVLSVEGYEALAYDPDGTTVVLNSALLRQQFGLGT